MNVEIDCPMISAEVSDSARQMKMSFAAVLEPLAKKRADFEHMSRLCVGVTVSHPTSLISTRSRGSYSKSIQTYFVSAPVDYALFVSRSWDARADAFADAIRKAIMQVPKSRMTAAERSKLNELIDQSRCLVRGAPPATIQEIKSVQIHLDESGSRPVSINYDTSSSTPVSDHVIEVLPGADLSAWLRASQSAPTGEVPISKLYKRDGDQLRYYEAWRASGPVIEHWGVCGERGHVREHPVAEESEATIIKKLMSKAKSDGFRSVPKSRHAKLVVEYSLDGFGHEDDLNHRHDIEKLLDQQTGWLGLGHCDGGSTGSDTMEVFCIGVDFDIAKAALMRELSGSPYSGYQRMYRLN